MLLTPSKRNRVNGALTRNGSQELYCEQPPDALDQFRTTDRLQHCVVSAQTFGELKIAIGAADAAARNGKYARLGIGVSDLLDCRQSFAFRHDDIDDSDGGASRLDDLEGSNSWSMRCRSAVLRRSTSMARER